MNGQAAPQQDPLSQLRDIHTPDPISWWPLAPGWWILAGLVIIGLVFLIRWLIKRKNHQTAVTLAKSELLPLKEKPANKQNLVDALHIYRRAALTQFEQSLVATVSLRELSESLAAQHNKTLAPSTVDLLHHAQYAPNINISENHWRLLIDDIHQLISLLPNSQLSQRELTNV